MSALTPTDEQTAIVDGFFTGSNLIIEAGAGTGKTSTLKMLAGEAGRRRGVYIAYNKAIQVDAQASFPSTVMCKTAHGLAYGAVGRQFSSRLNGPRQRAQDTANLLRINEPIQVADGKGYLAPQALARLVMETIGKFCYSADAEIGRYHVPLVNGVDEDAERAELARYLVPIAQRAWNEDITQLAGRLRFTHDMYLKIWCLSRPQIGADYVLLDEAQDSNPAVASLVTDQDAQQILVGDRNQAIYGWRGAADAMQSFDGKRLYLSQSFRFGPAIADEANKWLARLHAPLRLSGYEQYQSRVEACADPRAILCRSNAGAIARVMTAVAAGRRVALVGGGNDIKRMADAALALKSGKPTDHPELFAFSTWLEVQDYVDSGSEGSDLKVFVRLIDQWGPAAVIRVCDELVDEAYAGVVVSTAHKAKGREWPTVQIANDFPGPKPDEDGPVLLAREDAMLAYVSVTRAQQVLDPEGLSWVDRVIVASPHQPHPYPHAETATERFLASPAIPDDEWPAPVVPAPEQPAADPIPEHHERIGSYLVTGWCQRCQHPDESYVDCTCPTLPPDRQVRRRADETDEDVLARLLAVSA